MNLFCLSWEGTFYEINAKGRSWLDCWFSNKMENSISKWGSVVSFYLFCCISNKRNCCQQSISFLFGWISVSKQNNFRCIISCPLGFTYLFPNFACFLYKMLFTYIYDLYTFMTQGWKYIINKCWYIDAYNLLPWMSSFFLLDLMFFTKRKILQWKNYIYV